MESLKSTHDRLVRAVLNCPTAPFREDRVVDLVHQIAARLDHVRFRRDRDGNLDLHYRKGPARTRRPLILQAHLDHPGFIALSQTRTNRVTARFVGLVDPAFFPGAGVVFHGVEAVRAKVLSTRKPRGEKDLRVELEAEGRVEPGVPGVWDLPTYRRRGNFIETVAADDLMGVAAILCALEDVANRGDDADVRVVFTRGEEAGYLGAIGMLEDRRLPRDARVVTVEGTQALTHVRPGGGPVLRVGDRRSVYSPRLTGALDLIGRELERKSSEFTFRRALMDGGVCESTVFGLYGHEAACLCLPVTNLHNMTPRGRIGPERVHLGDLAGLIRYLDAIIGHDLDLEARDARTRTRLAARYRRLEKEFDPT